MKNGKNIANVNKGKKVVKGYANPNSFHNGALKILNSGKVVALRKGDGVKDGVYDKVGVGDDDVGKNVVEVDIVGKELITTKQVHHIIPLSATSVDVNKDAKPLNVNVVVYTPGKKSKSPKSTK
ncbi:hypothetical protein K7X08_030888 [Anisodus acutangulus]|uniref:Uncharacterized protein n=1 Tax=Anisodus acutangulus TaxID=402998 RepID=A0A9Q1M1U5_9SOLA|nr:hypothetical protein K7X08_030888 [Anisodus acutangulus]